MNEMPHGSSKITAIACTLAVLLVGLVALFVLRERLREEIHESTRAQTLAQEALGARIDNLKTSVEAITTSAKPDSESLTALQAKLTEMSVTIDALNARIEVLEKNPATLAPALSSVVITPPQAAPAAPIAAIAPSSTFANLALLALSGKPYAAMLDAWEKATAPDSNTSATLRLFAQSGIPSEGDILRQLRTTLDSLASDAKSVDDVSVVGKINTHLAGLVSIKKSGTDNHDAYASVRAEFVNGDVTRLIQSVERLDEPTRAPLNEWLKTAKARGEALAILSTASRESSQ